MYNDKKRSRIYYTKAQIQNGLITSGKEWMFMDTEEYIGQYHIYTTGEIFSEATFVDGKSRILIPFVETTLLEDSLNQIGINPLKNFEYDTIKQVDVSPSIIPNKSIILITKSLVVVLPTCCYRSRNVWPLVYRSN